MLSLSALGIPLAFAFPWALIALLALPVIWWLLRLTPPRPASEPFPPTRILAELINREETPARSPWWLTLLRLAMAIFAILAMALPVWNPQNSTLEGEGPLLMVIDNGWASGDDWQQRLASANAIIDQAREANRPIIAIATVQDTKQKIEIVTHDVLREKLASWTNQPIDPDYQQTAKLIAEAKRKFSPSSFVFLSDGVENKNSKLIKSATGDSIGQKILYLPDTSKLVVINTIDNQPEAMIGELSRANIETSQSFKLVALDIKGASVNSQLVSFKKGEKTAKFRFEIPVELRNDIVRVNIAGIKNAGATKLLDESNRRRLVGLISGEKHDNSQPLLSPLYYISRALEPFSDIRRARDANVVKSVTELITSGVSTIVLADVGVLPPQTSAKLQTWVENGGMLIRFAGPRLAASPENTLLPVNIRRGDRNIGGALSWEEPKPVAEFELGSPFFGLQPPQKVFVSRQVLALQEGDLANKTWARLTDGTPLVTADKMRAGWIVLFHVSSDATWSNLPISGTFVEMLRRVVNQSRSSLALATTDKSKTLPPLRTMNGKGELTSPPANIKPMKITNNKLPLASSENPPGFYGTEDGFRALNLFNGNANLVLMKDNFLGPNTTIAHYAKQQSTSLKPWALLIVAMALILDCLAVLWMAGLFGFLKSNKQLSNAAFAFFLIFTFVALVPNNVFAQSANNDAAPDALSEEFDFTPSLRTRLAYVITGVSSVDETSEAGLRGLTKIMKERTAIEPAEPIGVDISSDELAFYPMIYWPIHTDSELPDAQTMARIDAYMKQGGSVLFDTRDQISGFVGGSSNSPEAIHLQQILGSLDIPPLEPVPADHVLTKSFFILSRFPGRYSGGDLWVEQQEDTKNREARPVRSSDGVSSILITSNDFAGAWAIDAQSRAMFTIVPPNPIQREMAYRVGVNLIMYAMTGNYKSDQVHIPALLERLGQ